MYDIKQIFSTNIKRIRKLYNLTQEQFAEKIGMQWKSVVNFESARNVANSENLQSICNNLDIAPAELFAIFNENNSDKEIIEKINVILNKMPHDKLKEAHRIISVLNDEKHFIE